MPWSLRKFLSSKDQHSPTEGGDKAREKKGKSSKQEKAGKKSQQKIKVDGEAGSGDTSQTSPPESPEKSFSDPSADSKRSLNARRIDISTEQSSDDTSFASEDLISNKVINLDDDYKPVDDYPAIDCSNLSGYLETAILESAGNTLERPSKTSKDIPPGALKIDLKEPENMNVIEENEGLNVEGLMHPPLGTPAETSFDGGLYVEYVNYDLVGADASSGSSGEYYSSDDEADGKFLNSNNNSNKEIDLKAKKLLQLTVPATHGPRRGAGNLCDGEERPNNNFDELYYDRDEGSKNNKTEQEEGKSADEVERNDISGSGDGNSSEKEHSSIDLTGNQGDATTGSALHTTIGNNTEVNRRKLEENCSVHNGNVDLDQLGDTWDMEKARSIFGMCLCQNGEQMDNVTDLDYRNCNLKQVPHDIFQYAQTLTQLQLDSNTLSDLPKSLFSCENLEHLTVSDNDLGSLPLGLAGLANLKYLDISKNVIEDVPDCIRCCKSLTVLDASVNPIERLSEGFTQLVGLNELYLNDCFLEFLPANFGRLVQLTVLELRDNQLQILPKSIRRLNLLKRLDLGGNIFQEWPHVICELRRLTELWLDGNELSSVPEEVGDLSSLVYLDLSRNFIEAIPSQVGSLRELTDLLLCENHITGLPDTIGFLDKLTMMKASMNQLSAIPESIGKLREVEELDLSHNKLTAVPPTIGNLTKVHTLLLDNNILGSVPAELGKCERLNVLQLSRNLLEEIPREIGDLSQLRVFNICRNRLTHLPITVIKLAQLEALWVSSNQSKPNVPLHAELAPDGKTRILTNILFPQTEQDLTTVREKTDQDGYANDTADDDEPPLFRKQRGVTRVAFNLDPICREDSVSEEEEEEDMGVDVPLVPKDQNFNEKFPSDHHSVDVSSADIRSNGLRIQPSSLMVRSPVKSDDLSVESNEDSPDSKPKIVVDTSADSSAIEPMIGVEEWSDSTLPYVETLVVAGTPSVTSEIVLGNDIDTSPPDLAGKNNSGPPQSLSVPDLRKASVGDDSTTETSKSTVDVTPGGDNEANLTPKIKTWSSHTHLPSIPTAADAVSPVAAEIISNRSSMSSSPSLVPEDSSKSEPSPKTSRLPIPSRAIYEQPSKKVSEHVEKPQDVPQKGPSVTPMTPNKDPLVGIPFVDSDVSEESEIGPKVPTAAKLKVKPPPPPRKDSLLSKNSTKLADPSMKPPVPLKPTLSSSTGLKFFTPALLHRPKQTDDMNETTVVLPPHLGPKPPLEASPDGLPSTDHDSGVGNDADSQESIPECQDEDVPPPPPRDVVMDAPSYSHSFSAPKPQTVKSVASFHVSDVRASSAPSRAPDPKSPPSYAPVILASNSSQPPPIAAKPSHSSNKITASIKMFENISHSPERKVQQPTSKSLADLLPTGPRKTEEKAVIRPNNHLNEFVRETASPADSKPEVTSPTDPPSSPLKPARPDVNVLPEQQPAVTAFLRNDDDLSADASAFSRALAEMTSSPEKKKSSRTNSSSEAAKQNQFRERLEKIMQQQKSVSAATKAAQNGGAALSLSRKTSFNANLSQPTSPTGSGLAKSEHEYPVSPDPVTSPKKSHAPADRVKSKLGPGMVKSASSSRIARTRPGSAPAAQLLQRRNSNQRNSIAAPENGADEKRTLAPLYASDARAGMSSRSRSKSIEQQLGQLFLDSDEERLNHDERINHERRHEYDVTRREHRLRKDAAGFRGSRNSLCSPPPVRHNMYAKARSSTNTANASLADWKHKLLQHIERKRLEKQQISALQSMGRPTTQQPQRSLGKIKSPPRTSGPTPKQGPNYSVAQPQPRREHLNAHPNNHRPMGKPVTTSTVIAPSKTFTNTHQYNPEGPGVRSHFSGQSRAARLAKQRTFTPGPENHGVAKMIAPRPKSAMDKFISQPQVEPSYAEPPTYNQPHQPSLYADLRSYKQQQQQFPLPTYEDHLHRRAVPREPPQQLVRSESTRKSFRSSSRGRPNYEDYAGYPLRQAGSHESLMDAARHNHHDVYFPTTPLRNASSHDSVLDQPPYQPASYAPPYYGSPPQQQRYPGNHVPQRYPIEDSPSRSKYTSPDYATYVNVYDYDRSPVEYHNRPQIQQDPYRPQMGYRGGGGVRADPRQLQRSDYAQNQGNYSNYAYPPASFHDPRRPPTYEQHYRQREPLSPTLYRPLAEREDCSVASAFRPYQQAQQGVIPSHKPHHHNPYMPAYGLPPNQVLSPSEYQAPRNTKQSHGRHVPQSNYQFVQEQPRHLPRPPPRWADQQEDFERVTVSVRRSPTFGFHVMGGVGAGGNPYRAMDEGVFVTHVSPGGAADNKLQAGDKILLVNGSDFVGISHKRAVDLLRNAGQVAVLVVERSLGKPV